MIFKFLSSASSQKAVSQGVGLGLACASLLSGGVGLVASDPALASSATTSEQPIAQATPPAPVVVQTIPSNAMPGAYIDAVIMDAARRANISPASVKILQSREMTFGNPCIFNFGEICTKEYRPINGYEVLTQVNGQTWNYHVDRTGSQVVLDPKVAASTVIMPRDLQTRILTDAANRSGLPAASLLITQATQRTFDNACVFNFGEICPMIYQPIAGWEATVKVRDQFWTYRINSTGSQIAVSQKSTNTATLPTSVETAILQDAKAWTNSSDIRIVRASAQTWSNECAFNFGKVCPMNYQPIEGWQVQVSNGSLEWLYHTNRDGSQVVMDQRSLLPEKVADAIVRDVIKRNSASVNPNALRFLAVNEQSQRVCFLFSGCRMEPSYGVVIANGRQQWGYQSDNQGRRVVPVAIAQAQQTTATNTNPPSP